MALQRCPHPNSQNLWMLQKRLAGVIKLRILSWGRWSWITWVNPRCDHKDPYKREARRSKEEVGDVMNEPRDWCDSRKGSWAKECRWPQELKRTRGGFSLGASRRNQPCQCWTSAQWNWFWISDLRICKRITLFCFKHWVCGNLLQSSTCVTSPLGVRGELGLSIDLELHIEQLRVEVKAHKPVLQK